MSVHKIIALCFLIVVLLGCDAAKVFPVDKYDCSFSFNDTSQTHPKATIYQNILEEYRKDGLVGAVLCVKDKDGIWIGASGKADIPSDVDTKPCSPFLIASITKTFTATAIFKYVDKGVLSLNDPITKWLSSDITDKIGNGNTAQIKHLLSHTSGIPNFVWTNNFGLDTRNSVNNARTKEDYISYIYGKKAYFPVGETYTYSNTNTVLLAMILEAATGLNIGTIYEQEIFSPLNLTSAYYNENQPIPDNCVRGYTSYDGDGKVIDAQHLYEDDFGIGGHTGIAINAYDLAIFLEVLMKGAIISTTSLNEMTNWFDKPEGWTETISGITKIGYGLFEYNTEYGRAAGHPGSIQGFEAIAFYFPEKDRTYVLLVNSNVLGNSSPTEYALFKEKISKEMFD